jgi:hypothetical protein
MMTMLFASNRPPHRLPVNWLTNWPMRLPFRLKLSLQLSTAVLALSVLSGCAWLDRIIKPAPEPSASPAPAPTQPAPAETTPPSASSASGLPARRSGPINQLVVLLDEDFINAAFEGYVSAVPTRRPDARAFTAALGQSLRSGLSNSEVAAELHVLSFKDSNSRARVRLQNRPTLVIRMLNGNPGGRQAVASLNNRGWDGSSIWTVQLSEPNASQSYSVSWEERLENVRLDPQRCRLYDTCGQDLGRTILTQLREDAVIRPAKASNISTASVASETRETRTRGGAGAPRSASAPAPVSTTPSSPPKPTTQATQATKAAPQPAAKPAAKAAAKPAAKPASAPVTKP